MPDVLRSMLIGITHQAEHLAESVKDLRSAIANAEKRPESAPLVDKLQKWKAAMREIERQIDAASTAIEKEK